MTALRKADAGEPLDEAEQFAIEAIVIPDYRPALEIVANDYGPVANPAWSRLNDEDVRARLKPLFRSVGRIQVDGYPGHPLFGAGFVVGPDLVMTNRHIAELFSVGVGKKLMFLSGRSAAIDFDHGPDRGGDAMPVREVAMIHPFWDMALLRVEGLTDAHPALSLQVDADDEFADRDVVLLGYPAFDWRNASGVQERVFRGNSNAKRMSPGRGVGRRSLASFGHEVSAFAHDASTLGANSGAAIIDLETGNVIGLHFTSRYLEANYAAPAWEMAGDPHIVEAGVNFASSVRPSSARGAEWWKFALEGAAALAALGGAAMLASQASAAEPDAGKTSPDAGAPVSGAHQPDARAQGGDAAVADRVKKAALEALKGNSIEEAALNALGDSSLAKLARAAASNNAISKAAHDALGGTSLGQAAGALFGDNPLAKAASAAFGGAAPGKASDAGGALAGLAGLAGGGPPDLSAQFAALTGGASATLPAANGAPVTVPVQLNLRINVVSGVGSDGSPGGGILPVGAEGGIPVNLNFRFEHEINHTGAVNHSGEVNHSGGSGGSDPLKSLQSLTGIKAPGGVQSLLTSGLGVGVGAGVGTSVGPMVSALGSALGFKSSSAAATPASPAAAPTGASAAVPAGASAAASPGASAAAPTGASAGGSATPGSTAGGPAASGAGTEAAGPADPGPKPGDGEPQPGAPAQHAHSHSLASSDSLALPATSDSASGPLGVESPDNGSAAPSAASSLPSLWSFASAPATTEAPAPAPVVRSLASTPPPSPLPQPPDPISKMIHSVFPDPPTYFPSTSIPEPSMAVMGAIGFGALFGLASVRKWSRARAGPGGRRGAPSGPRSA
ncbi:S1 family peptidase [Roseiarcus fermentans]|nr:serine protease [Roseiarcus fermentans]